MNDRIYQNKPHQKGMALVEVMLAALVLSIGSAAFFKLQRIGLQHSFNDAARTQSTVVARSFVDALRSNMDFTYLASEKKTSAIIVTASEIEEASAAAISAEAIAAAAAAAADAAAGTADAAAAGTNAETASEIANAIKSSKIKLVSPPQSSDACTQKKDATGVKDTKGCAESILNYHIYLAKLQMLDNFQPGQSLLCFRESGDRVGYMRITMLWLDNSSKKGTTLAATNCPATFSAAAGNDDYINNSVTIYAQL